MRRAANRDKSEPAIVAALTAAGATVQTLDLKDGPDLLVGFRGVNYLAECKNPIGPRGGGTRDGQHLSDGQAAWHREWRGLQVAVIRTPADALALIGLTPTESAP